MTPNLMGLIALMPLLVLLIVVVRHDIMSHRIPNQLVLIGVLLGLALNGVLPAGWGFNSVIPGGLGWLTALQGMAVGLALFLPIYWLGAMGAGDVKLMAMVGAFVGPVDILGVALATFIAGGLMALLVLIYSKQLLQALENLKLLLLGSMIKLSVGQMPPIVKLPVSVGKLPYAVAITVGTLTYLIWQRS
jgi:prepilin peptidase CpaA